MTATIHALEGNASPRLVMAVRQDNIVGQLERMPKTLIVSLVSVTFDSFYIFFVVTDNFVIVNNYAVAVWPVTGQVFHNTK